MRFIPLHYLRCTAGLLVALMTVGVTGCGSRTINAQSGTPYSSGNGGTMPMSHPTGTRQGMTTGQKVMLLAGAAAVYYLYKKHQNAQGEGANGRYYLSKNGRVYWRDLKTGQYHWVTPPQQPMQVPASDYQQVTGQSPVENGGVIRQAPPGSGLAPVY